MLISCGTHVGQLHCLLWRFIHHLPNYTKLLLDSLANMQLALLGSQFLLRKWKFSCVTFCTCTTYRSTLKMCDWWFFLKLISVFLKLTYITYKFSKHFGLWETLCVAYFFLIAKSKTFKWLNKNLNFSRAVQWTARKRHVTMLCAASANDWIQYCSICELFDFIILRPMGPHFLSNTCQIKTLYFQRPLLQNLLRKMKCKGMYTNAYFFQIYTCITV